MAAQGSDHLLPVDFHYGPAAEVLIAAGKAGRLAGLPIAFTAVDRLLCWNGQLHRERLDWTAALGTPLVTDRVPPFDRPRLMGILNVTPDSFAKASRFPVADEAVAHGLRLIEEGAGIVDVGGESTRPGAAEVPLEEELRRVLPVVRRLAAAGATVSIDTRKARVMLAAVDAGASIINDVSGLSHDPEAPAVAAASGATVVLMHMRGEPATMNLAPAYDHAALEVYDELAERLARAEAAGIRRERLVIDPGLCFAKHEPHNVDVLRHLALYHGLGCPVLLGVSRKGWTAMLHERWRPAERLPATLAAGLWALQQGVHGLRVHDVDAHRQLLEAWRALSS